MRVFKTNLVSGNEKDETTVYEVGVDVTKRFTKPVSIYGSVSVQIVYDGLDGADSVFKIQASEDGVNFDDFTNGEVTISAESGSFTWTKDIFNASYISLLLTKGTSTTGTVKAIITEKVNF